MDLGQDGERVAVSLAHRLDRLTFEGLATDQVTARLVDAVAEWATGEGWRVYRRAASVLPLPPPLDGRQSVLDIACARPDRPPVVVEVDHTDRRRTVEKLLAEAGAGRIPIWLRWGVPGFAAPPEPIRMVTFEVSRRNGPAGQGRRYSRRPAADLPAPAHSVTAVGPTVPFTLPIPLPGEAD
ncbi:hypothetical protein [Micromonospora robiginosa]|uniref:Uncharacterized protein n=1 Tax=Micromonospora robiginosa TaxID=2749844 RepID=A0A7L6B2D6_9ACTN|nr:hypothetical protein [Micromonospora ferruginea]QLQ36001.1 hypothetical protein H1D33_22020 [Micromonospora ferruginea]